MRSQGVFEILSSLQLLALHQPTIPAKNLECGIQQRDPALAAIIIPNRDY